MRPVAGASETRLYIPVGLLRLAGFRLSTVMHEKVTDRGELAHALKRWGTVVTCQSIIRIGPSV